MPTPYESSEIRFSDLAKDASINALLGGTQWKDDTISYSYPSSNSGLLWSQFFNGYGSPFGNGEPWSSSFKPLTASERFNFEKALQQWANVADIQFVQVAETPEVVGDIRPAYTSDPDGSVLAWSYLPSYSPAASDIWINTQSQLNREEWNPGSMSFETLMHEIGHSLGLKHPFYDGSSSKIEYQDEIEGEDENEGDDDDDDDDEDDLFDSVLPDSLDKVSYTIMSYTYADLEGEEGTGFSFHPTTPMILDIAAIQYLYGANDDYHAGNNTYTYTDAQTYHETIWDADGTDAIVYNGTIPSLFDLNPAGGSVIGQSVYVQANGIDLGLPVPNVWIADGVTIENVTAGQSDDILIGNHGSNILNGGLGIDTVIVEAPRNQFSLSKSINGYTLSEKDESHNQDTLINIERLAFDDYKLALDLNGHAGEVAKIIGAVFGSNTVSNQMYVGIGLSKLDDGLSYEQLAALAINAAGLSDHDEIVALLWKNLFGSAPQESDISPYVNLLDSGDITIGGLTALAADSSFNVQNINLLELSHTGIAYL